jgi:hypothetical protein
MIPPTRIEERTSMTVPVRLAAFAAALALLFGAGLAAGDAFGPQRDVPDHEAAPSHLQEISAPEDREHGGHRATTDTGEADR